MADKEYTLRMGLDAARARTNLSEFKADFEATLRTMGKSDAEITAFKRLVRDMESGRTSVQSLSVAQQGMWRLYNEGATAARAQDALGLRSLSALQAEVVRLNQTYRQLEQSGQLSQAELARAAAATQAKIAQLNAEIAREQNAAQGAGDALRQAFSVVGVRSAEQIQAEIRLIDESLQRLQSDTRVSGAEFSRAFDTGISRIASLNNELRGTQSQIKATGTTLGLTAAQAKTNLSEFQAQFEAMLRSMGKSDAEVTAIKRLIADVESGRRAIQSLSAAEQAMWKTYNDGANAARAQDALGLKSISAYKAEIEKLNQTYHQLQQSGQLSQAELTRAAAATQNKIAQLNAEIARLEGETRREGNLLHEAFGVVGVRSAAQIQAEIRQIDNALQRLAVDTRVSGAEFNRAWSAGQTRINALNHELQGSHANMEKTGALTALSTKAMGALGMVVAALNLGQRFIEANVEIQNNTRALKALTGSAQAAGVEMEYLRGRADAMGVNLGGLTKQYTSLMAATKGTQLEGKKMREVFESITNAASTLGLSSEQTSRALMAVQQMVSKNKVSMEEMRQQLGESLPGAFQATARGAGLTTQELDQMISSGQVLAEDLLPAMAKGLNETFTEAPKKVEGLQQSWERYKQSWDDFFTAGGGGGVASVLGTTIDLLRIPIEALGKIVKWGGLLWDEFWLKANNTPVIGPMIRAIDSMVSAIKRENAAAEEELETSYKVRREKANAAREAIDRAQREEAASRKRQEAHQKEAQAQDQAAEASQSAADAQKKVAQATDAATDANNKNASGILYLMNLYKKADTDTTAYIELKKKELEVTQQEGQLRITMAQMLGSEAAVREAAVKTAENNLRAQNELAAAETAYVAVQRAKVQAMEAERDSGKKWSVDQEKRLQAFNTELQARETALAKTRASTAAMELEATKARLAAQTYLDNAASMKQYKAALDEAEVAVAHLEMRQKAGLATEQDVAAARRKVQEATVLYNDAINDRIAAAQREGELANRLAQMAGNEATARDVATKAARDNADATALVSRAKREEIEELRQKAIALQQEEMATGRVSEETKKQIAEIQQQIELKTQEATAAERSTTASKLEAEQLRVKAETYKDNSSRVNEYKAAAEAAQAQVERLTAAHKNGLATEAQLNDARIQAAGALAMYRDALNDAAAAAERKIQSLERDANVTQASLSLDLEKAKTAEKLANAHGNEKAAIAAKVAQKEIEIQMARANMELSQLEAKAIIAAAEADKVAAEATGDLTAAKKAEIEARIAAAKVKQIESEKDAEVVKQLQAEIEAIKNVNREKNAGSGGGGGAGGGGNGGRGGSRGNSGGSHDYGDWVPPSESGGQGGSTSGDGFIANPTGGKLPVGSSGHATGNYAELATDWAKVARRQGLRGKQVDKFLEVIGNIADDEDQAVINTFGPLTTTETQMAAMHGAYKRAVEKAAYIAQQVSIDYDGTDSSSSSSSSSSGSSGFGGIRSPSGGATANTAKATSASSSTASSSASTAGSTSHTVTVNIGTRSTTINTASAADASNLAAVLKSLEQAASSSM